MLLIRKKQKEKGITLIAVNVKTFCISRYNKGLEKYIKPSVRPLL